MSDILFFDNNLQQLITEVSFTPNPIEPGASIASLDLTIWHNSPYSVMINGFYLRPIATDYTGNQTPLLDCKELLRWGTEYNTGLKIGQVVNGVITYTLFKNLQGSSRDNPIVFSQNNGVMLTRGAVQQGNDLLDEAKIILTLDVPDEVIQPYKLNFGLEIDFYELSL